MSSYLTELPLEECYINLKAEPKNLSYWIKILSVSDFLERNWETLLRYSRDLDASELLTIHDIVRQRPYGKGIGRKQQRFLKNILGYYSHFETCEGVEAEALKQLMKILHYRNKRLSYVFVPKT